jgi:hypothetical protein
MVFETSQNVIKGSFHEKKISLSIAFAFFLKSPDG